MADNNKEEHQDMDLVRFLIAGDFTGAECFLRGIDEQDKQIMLFVKREEISAMLLAAAEDGNTAMVEFLVKSCKANIEKCRNFHTQHWVTPYHWVTLLWCAAGNGRLEVLNLLLELGANINAVSNTELTTVNYACSRRQIETVEFLVKRGADIHRPDRRGRTCLMNSVHCLELCKFLIDNGAVVNAQDYLGNTALHRAIKKSALTTVQFLLDHGSDQNIKNKLGDDALQFASLRGRYHIANELVARQSPTTLRRIESLQLLGSCFLFYGAGDKVEQALVCWRQSVLYRMKNSCAESSNSESMPACIIVQEVSTVEELEKISHDEKIMHMYALNNLFRILGPSHRETTNWLFKASFVFLKLEDNRRSVDLLKCAFQFLNECTPKWTKDFKRILTLFSTIVFKHPEIFEIGFLDIVEILDMLTSKAQSAFTVKLDITKLYVMKEILSFVLFLVKLDKSPDQLVSFKRSIHRLVQSQIRDEIGRTFLHHAVKDFDTYPGVAKVLLECGADVNAVDTYHSTALHSCRRPYTNSDSTLQNEESKVIELLLQYSAHLDIVNDMGAFAAKGLSLNMLDHVNLKCLATAVIRDHQIPYVGQIPESLDSFVKMHGRYPSENFRIRSRQTNSEMFLNS